MIILTDMDDVLIRLTETWCDELNKKFGTRVGPDDVKEWGMKVAFPELSSNDIYRPLHKSSFWAKVKPREDAIEYLRKLHDEGNKIFVVTSSNKDTIKYKYEHFIQKFFPYIKWSDMIICKNKQMIAADYLVDDGIHNLIGGKYHGILFDTAHNRNVDNSENIHRCKNWEEVYNYINSRKEIMK